MELNPLPCKKCGSTDIALDDCNYSSFNIGGGKCRKCGNESHGGVGTFPSHDSLVSNWNAGQWYSDQERMDWLQKYYERVPMGEKMKIYKGGISLRECLDQEMKREDDDARK